jgi:paraquat-inducible protein B
MSETETPHDAGDLPKALAVPRKRWQLPLVWLVPLLALALGGWLAVQAILKQGPTIHIEFQTGEGLVAGKTHIKYKDVDVGMVSDVVISPDRKSVIVTAKLSGQARDFAVEDTRFWVVKPRIAGGSVSGLDTLLSGAFIGVDVGKSDVSQTEFKGLEVPPMLIDGLPGKRFQLRAENLGSIDYGVPVYFRKLAVGQVVAYDLDKDGQGALVTVFVSAPYDRFVTEDTRFWSSSGLDFSVDANGLRFNTESLSTMLVGGLVFGSPSGTAAPAAKSGAQFVLYDSQQTAMREHDTQVELYRLVFHQTVHGLVVGAPVEFRGIQFGEVASIGLSYDTNTQRVDVPVVIKVFPERLQRYTTDPATKSAEILDKLIESGLRAQLRSGSLLTGQLYVAFDFFPGVAKAVLSRKRGMPEIPTVDGSLNELEASITSITRKIDKIPFEAISQDLRSAITSLDSTVKQADILLKQVNQDVAPELKRTLAGAQQTMQRAERLMSQDAPLQQDLRDTLREVSRAAASMRSLTDYLDRHPEALIRGRTPDEDKP